MTAPIALLTVPEVAGVLKVHANTVWTLFRRRLLKRVKVGRTTRVRQSDLEKYIDSPGRRQ